VWLDYCFAPKAVQVRLPNLPTILRHVEPKADATAMLRASFDASPTSCTEIR